jgi:hypothetical protein
VVVVVVVVVVVHGFRNTRFQLRFLKCLTINVNISKQCCVKKKANMKVNSKYGKAKSSLSLFQGEQRRITQSNIRITYFSSLSYVLSPQNWRSRD